MKTSMAFCKDLHQSASRIQIQAMVSSVQLASPLVVHWNRQPETTLSRALRFTLS